MEMAQPTEEARRSNRFWEESCLSENDRIKINGETKELMSHVRKVKATPRDTSVDQEWSVDDSLWKTDAYVQIATVAYILPKCLMLMPPLLLTSLPFCAFTRLYVACLPTPTDYVQRNTVGFFAFALLGHFLLVLPGMIIALSLMLDYFFYYLFSMPYCLLTCNLSGFSKSLKVIKPYTSGPSIRSTDFLVTMLGQSYRHGIAEITLSFTMMVMLIPWMKYFIQANPWLYPLEERFVQQITTANDDTSIDMVADTVRRIISRTKQDKQLADRIERWKFVPHYPYPPPSRRWALGMQKGGCMGSCLLVHTTHASAKVGASQEQLVLSNSVEQPVWRVMLWHSNPYHFLTGFVEASITTGEMSQREKKNGGEHPMWLVTSRSPMVSARTHCFPLSVGPGKVDQFFDKWLPCLVYEIRLLVHGKEVADAKYQGVISKDGVSRPDPQIGIGNYNLNVLQPFSGERPVLFGKAGDIAMLKMITVQAMEGQTLTR